MNDVTTEQLLKGFAKATTEYIADERSTHESCAALGKHTREMLEELGLEKEFQVLMVSEAEGAIQKMFEELLESVNADD